ncbi:MAG: M20/M25/M40 family metallo-hydrolase, partial [Clostridiales bacterium]|nr:M20/M25/M40 family metallo-hydrolase [Clostridiales bacterium]
AGRGAFDTKGSLRVILSALNHLAEQGFVPGRDIYVLSTASEEVSGPDAPAACQYFKDRGIRLELVMDEGGGLLRGLVPGFSGEIAGIGISETSQANPVFVAKVSGGHASTPPRRTALGKLGAFMVDVEKNQPFDYRMTPEFKEMLMSVAPYMSFPFRLVRGNLWCFGPLLTAILKRSPDARTLMGTTCSFTMIEGSDAFNVLPNEARVTANMRVSHHQGVKGSLDAIEKVAKKHGLEMQLMEKNPGFEVKAISSTKTEGYQSLKKVINEVYPEAKVAPYIMMANTDCRYFHEVCDTALRFMPIRITNDERKHIHTVNEYTNTDTYATGAEVIMRLVEES